MVIHQNFSDPYLTPRQWSIVPRWRNYKKADGASTFTGDGFIWNTSVLDYISDVIIYYRNSNGGGDKEWESFHTNFSLEVWLTAENTSV